MPLFVQPVADGADAAVHHVGGGDDIGAGAGLDERLFDEDRDGLVVEDVAVLVQQAVMAVAGEGIEGDVAGDADFGGCGLHGLDDGGDEAFGVDGFVAAFVLLFGIDVREDGDGGDAQFAGADGGLGRFIDVQSVDAGHGFHRDAGFLAVVDDHAPDDVVGAGLRLAAEPARPVELAQAAQAGGGIGAGDQGLGHKLFLYRNR